MRALNRLAFEVSGVIIVTAITYTLVTPLCAWLAGI
jgi:hypothetical protein